MAKPNSVKRGISRRPSARGHVGGLPVPADRKAAILRDAKAEILEGKTIDQIAAKHGIAHSTLEYWLSSLGDEYLELRKAWLDGMLIESGSLLKEASDPLGLARARELWRRATWYAERRDRARYGQDQPTQQGQLVQINIGIRRDEPLPVVAEQEKQD